MMRRREALGREPLGAPVCDTTSPPTHNNKSPSKNAVAAVAMWMVGRKWP